MKKVFGISLLVLVVLVFGVLPGVMGILAERATVSAMNSPLPNNYPVTFQLVSYQRHWFSSDVIYTVTVKSLTATAPQSASGIAPTGVTVTEKVYHGPIVITRNLAQTWHIYVGQALAKGTLTASPAGSSFQSFFPQANVAAAGPFRELTTLGLFGHLRIQIAAPALTITSTAATNTNVVKFSPTDLYVSTNRSMKKFGFGLTIPGVNVFNQGNLVFTLNRWDLQAKLHRSPEQLLLGWVNLQIADMNATAMGGRHVDLQNFVLSAKSDINSKLLDSDSQINFARLTIDDKQFGPGVAKLSFKRFDPKAQAQLARLNSYGSPQTPWAQAAMVHEASRLFSKLIAHGAQIVASPVNVKTSDGDVNLSLSLAFPNVKGKISLPSQLHDTNANFTLTLPKALAHRVIDATNRRQIQVQMGANVTPNGATNIDAMVTAERTNQVNNWLSRGFVVSKGDNYTLSLSYKQGSAFINGKNFKQFFAAPTTSLTAVVAGQNPPVTGTQAQLPNTGGAPITGNASIPTPVATTSNGTITAPVPAAVTSTNTDTAPTATVSAPALPSAPVPTTAPVGGGMTSTSTTIVNGAPGK